MKTKEQINQRIQEIGALESVEEMRSAMAGFQQELEADYDEANGIMVERDDLIARNGKLEKANMDLFLQIGDKKEPEKTPEKQDKKFEDLFNEKGELK